MAVVFGRRSLRVPLQLISQAVRVQLLAGSAGVMVAPDQPGQGRAVSQEDSPRARSPSLRRARPARPVPRPPQSATPGHPLRSDVLCSLAASLAFHPITAFHPFTRHRHYLLI